MKDNDPVHLGDHESDLLDAYLAGELRGEPLRRVEAWLSAVPDRRGVVNRFVERAMNDETSVDVPSAIEIVAPIRARVHASEPAKRFTRAPHIQAKLLTSRGSRPWVAAGAILGVVVAVVIASRYTGSASELPASRSYTTRVGERATIHLDDGTRVVLASQTSLVVANGFGKSRRDVSLSGEAYFDVAHTGGAPFVVTTGAITTRVLGTTFDVRSYPTDSVVRVVVASGKVAAGGSRMPITLTAGTVGEMTDTTATATVAGDVSAYTEWTDGRLVFDDMPASTILSTVGKWYGYDFRLADSALAAQHFTVVFDINAKEKTLRALEALLDVAMRFDGTTVTLRPGRDRRSLVPPARHGGQSAFSSTSEVGR